MYEHTLLDKFKPLNITVITDLRISPESTQAHLPSRDGSDGVDDDCHKGLLEVLVEHLRGNVDSREPAAVARVAVVPTYCVFVSTHLGILLNIRN